MRKIIAAMNITLDGYCDHTAGIADDELHEHYSELLSNSGTILYGRITFQLMQYWQDIVKNPTGIKATDEFATIIDKTPKIVFSRTLDTLDWESAILAKSDLKEEAMAQKQLPGKPVLVGSPGLISELTRLHLIDEYQLCIHPVILGSGLPLFKHISERIVLKLLKTKTLGSGAIVLYYEPA